MHKIPQWDLRLAVSHDKRMDDSSEKQNDNCHTCMAFNGIYKSKVSKNYQITLGKSLPVNVMCLPQAQENIVNVMSLSAIQEENLQMDKRKLQVQ